MSKILNYGSINIDESFIVPRICLSGETLSSSEYFVRAGGKGANQSIAFAKAGGRVYHSGNFGYDAVWIKDYMAENGVDMRYSRVNDKERNGRAFIQVSKETGDNCIVLYPGTNGTYTVEEAAVVLNSFGPSDWIVQQNEISHGGKIMQMAAERGLNVFFNPAPLTKGILQEFLFNKVTILVVNEHEAQSLYEELGGSKTNVFGLDMAAELLQNFDKMQGVVITLGGEGVVARFKHNDKAKDFKVPSRKVKVKDTTGAGDTFVGYFLAAFIRAEKEDYFQRVEKALQEANVASSIAVQHSIENIMFSNFLFMLLLSAVVAQQTPTVSTNGFREDNNDSDEKHESWLQKNDRYIFIIILSLLILAILIWYIVRSIKSMRKRLADENQGHMMMVQNVSGGGFSETVPVDANGFHKMSDYPQQQPPQYTHRY
ncbi:hypothetical protein [Parasitella parasitica]|uniref:Carbohydrate kinase PfkB domain-containing protein n=1 Tax=Parasitella parasitica TaxID=35722 RepID=A0A0B7NVI5_9FUNG|nr:hypothetical protein [Parasitella parasitica]